MSVADNYIAITSAVESDSALDDLTSTSKVGFWRSMAYAVARAWEDFKLVINAARDEVYLAIATAKPGTIPNICYLAKQFRWDAANGAAYAYEIDADTKAIKWLAGDDDPNALIVTLAVGREFAGFSTINVAKGTADSRTPLSPTEVLAFTEYMNEAVRIAGQRIGYRSTEADNIRITANMLYYPAYGPQADNALAAITALINTGLDSNATLRQNDIEAAVRALPGVQDFQIRELQWKPDGAIGWRNVINQVRLPAGYAKIIEHDFTPREVVRV